MNGGRHKIVVVGAGIGHRSGGRGALPRPRRPRAGGGPTTLGYSCAGVVAAVGSQVDAFRVGDRVACIGEAVATHAEYNAVPCTLVAPVPANVSLEAASSSAIGAIALHGIRQARLQLGASVAVIGLGLLGQFLVQLCSANGCRVMGVDLVPASANSRLLQARQAVLRRR